MYAYIYKYVLLFHDLYCELKEYNYIFIYVYLYIYIYIYIVLYCQGGTGWSQENERNFFWKLFERKLLIYCQMVRKIEKIDFLSLGVKIHLLVPLYK